MITIEVRATGARRSLIPKWQLPVDEIVPGGSPLTLREFIDRVVRREVAGFRDRQVEQRLLHILSQREVAEAARAPVVFPPDRGTDLQVSSGVSTGNTRLRFAGS